MIPQVAFPGPLAPVISSVCNSSVFQFPSPLSFYALGDSFSAGIGANCGWIKDEFDAKGSCLKCDGGYPYQIITAANASDCMDVYHVGCTGASMDDILDIGWDGRSSQLELMSSKSGLGGWATLSIGGNDVGFGDIVANCIMFNHPSCDDDLKYTELMIANPLFLTNLTTTYLQILTTASHSQFKLLVTSYAQFFNEETEICDHEYFFYGRYLTQEFRARVNKMVSNLNLVIQIAVSIVQLQLILANSRKGVYYEDWDSLFTGHRFCEDVPNSWPNAWFFSLVSWDTLPNGTIIDTGADPPPEFEKPVNLTSLALECEGQEQADLAERMLCDWALNLKERREPSEGTSSRLAYPNSMKKTMHPKSIAHWELGKMIYKKWVSGEYA